MSTIKLTLPDSLYHAARELAAKDHVSINQFITVAVAEKISALITEKRASKAKFETAMAKVADIEPETQDRL